MNLQSTINKDYWLAKNSAIEFHGVKKAFYGTHLLKAKVYVCGASMSYYQNGRRFVDPTFDGFMEFLKTYVVRFNSKLIKVVDDRYIYVNKSFPAAIEEKIRIYDVHILYAFYKMLKKKPAGIRFSRISDTIHIYGNNINDIEETINQLKIPSNHIISITSPDEQDVAVLLSGKEISNKADRFQYKVFLKPAFSNPDPTLSLYNYLESIKDTDEVEVPPHCKAAIHTSTLGWSWENIQRSYLYVKNKNTILLIKLLAGKRYSTCVELILPKKELDK